jgi:glycosyltransferase involved in cell wall biosynthesis
MKIYINARFLTQPVSGVQRYGIECSRKIKKLYPESVFLAPDNIWNKAVADELEVLVVGKNKGHLWEQIDLPFFLRKLGSPPLFSPCNTAPLIYTNNFMTLHDLAFLHHPEWNSKWFSMWYNFLIPRVVARSKHVFTVSQTVKEEISKYYGVPRAGISVTYNGISEGMLCDGRPQPVEKEKVILAVGSFNIRKNHQSLINAFIASDIKNSYKLVLVGDRNKVFSETGIDERELEQNNIQVLKQLTDAELQNVYSTAEILVSLSAYEGFGIPILEGLYAGCKVVCSDIPVYRELYNDQAFFCAPYDLNSIKAAISLAARSPQPDPDGVNRLLKMYDYEKSARVIISMMSGRSFV